MHRRQIHPLGQPADMPVLPPEEVLLQEPAMVQMVLEQEDLRALAEALVVAGEDEFLSLHGMGQREPSRCGIDMNASDRRSSGDTHQLRHRSQPSGSFWRTESGSAKHDEASFSSMVNVMSPPFTNCPLLQLQSESMLAASGPSQALITLTNHQHSSSSCVLVVNEQPRRRLSWRLGSSLIFPSGASAACLPTSQSESELVLHRKINHMLDQCETMRFPFSRKLVFDQMELTAKDIPMQDLDGTRLGATLSKLSLMGNRLLETLPTRLVQCLPALQQLDLSQCDLYELPESWKLPRLNKLDLSHNKLTEFPNESMLQGLPELQGLNMQDNKITEIIIPQDTRLLSRLEKLDVSDNALTMLPDNLDQLKSLRALKLSNNALDTIPMRVCCMGRLRQLEVSCNPITQPPKDACDRGLGCMKRYYRLLRQQEQKGQVEERSDTAMVVEEQTKQALDATQPQNGVGRWSVAANISNGLQALAAPKVCGTSLLPIAHHKPPSNAPVSSSSLSSSSPSLPENGVATDRIEGPKQSVSSTLAGMPRHVPTIWIACFIAWVLYLDTTKLVNTHFHPTRFLQQLHRNLFRGRRRVLLHSPTTTITQNAVQDLKSMKAAAKVSIAAGPATAVKATRPRFILGIFGTFQDQKRRNTIRQALNMYNDSRLCSFGTRYSDSFSLPPDCQVAYTFVIGSNPNGPTSLHPDDAANQSNSFQRLRQLTYSDPLQYLDGEPNDVTLLNIEETNSEGKSLTWLYYALLLMDESKWGDFIIKCDARAGLRLDVFLDQTVSLLPSSGHNLDVYGGFMFNTQTTGSLYMRGRFYMLSRHLAVQVVTTAAVAVVNPTHEQFDTRSIIPEDQAIGASVLNLNKVIHWASFLPESNHMKKVSALTLSCVKFPLRTLSDFRAFIEAEKQRFRQGKG